MIKYYWLFSFLLISLLFISCGKKNNPIGSNNSSSNWKEIAKIDEVSSPKVHFFNKEEGIIEGQVYYKSMNVLGPPSLGYGKDTVILTQDKLVSTTPDTEKYPLWKTYDGGKTWIPIKGFFQTSIKDLYFVDNSTGFLVTEEEGVFKTMDGGDTWDRCYGAELLFYMVFNNGGGGIDNSIPEEVSFSDNENGIISMTYGPDGRLYLVTNNGGVTWDFNYLSFKVTNIIFPEKDNKTGYGSTYDSIVKTKDGGLTWEVIAKDLVSPQFSFYDINNGVYCNEGKIYITSDGGATFKEVNSSQEINHAVRSDFLSFIDKIYYTKTSCYILANGSIIKSTDGCNTFQVLNSSDVSGIYFSDLSIPNDSTIYAISNDDVLYLYNNKE